MFLGGFNTPVGGANTGGGVGAGSKAGGGAGADGGRRSKRSANNVEGARNGRQQRPPGSFPPQQGRQPQNDQNQQGLDQN